MTLSGSAGSADRLESAGPGRGRPGGDGQPERNECARKRRATDAKAGMSRTVDGARLRLAGPAETQLHARTVMGLYLSRRQRRPAVDGDSVKLRAYWSEFIHVIAGAIGYSVNGA